MSGLYVGTVIGLVIIVGGFGLCIYAFVDIERCRERRRKNGLELLDMSKKFYRGDLLATELSTDDLMRVHYYDPHILFPHFLPSLDHVFAEACENEMDKRRGEKE